MTLGPNAATLPSKLRFPLLLAGLLLTPWLSHAAESASTPIDAKPTPVAMAAPADAPTLTTHQARLQLLFTF